jgi:hypothetical protein
MASQAVAIPSMRYRKVQGFGLGPAVDGGDYTFGQGQNNFWVNNPTTVAQAILTALLLHLGEWFLNKQVGMPWETQVLGFGTQSLYDAAIKNCVLGVQGVQSIVTYSSNLDAETRKLTVSMIVNTIYGQVSIGVTL